MCNQTHIFHILSEHSYTHVYVVRDPEVQIAELIYCCWLRTDKREKKIFLMYKEIQSGTVAKSYVMKGFLIYEEIKKNAQIFPQI